MTLTVREIKEMLESMPDDGMVEEQEYGTWKPVNFSKWRVVLECEEPWAKVPLAEAKNMEAFLGVSDED